MEGVGLKDDEEAQEQSSNESDAEDGNALLFDPSEVRVTTSPNQKLNSSAESLDHMPSPCLSKRPS